VICTGGYSYSKSNLTRPQTTRTRNKPRAGRQSRPCTYIILQYYYCYYYYYYYYLRSRIYGEKRRSSNIALPRSWSLHDCRRLPLRPLTRPHMLWAYDIIYVSHGCALCTTCACSAFAGLGRKMCGANSAQV